jgi:glucosyl-3-phosphoglycerate phosphatase
VAAQVRRGDRDGRRVVIWRHGETDHNAQGIWQGHLDTALSATGRAQAAAAAAALAAHEPAVIVASDLQRAAETARALAAVVGREVRYDERLREIHVGQWQGMSAGDVAARYPADQEALARGEDLPRGVDGETVAQVVARGRAAFEELLDDLGAGECAVVATHGVAGRAMAASLVGLDQHQAWLSLGGLFNAHWAELREGRLGWRITAWNVGAGVD